MRVAALISSSVVLLVSVYGCSGSNSSSTEAGGSSGAHSGGGAGHAGIGGTTRGGATAAGESGVGGAAGGGSSTESAGEGGSDAGAGGAAGVGEGGSDAGAGEGGSDAGASGAAGAGGEGCPAVAQVGAGGGAASCLALLAANSSLTDGTYAIDLDGDGPFPSLPYYCDMTGGGWTLVANQVPDTPLPDSVCTVNPTGFGTFTQSYRLGVPDIASIRPTVAWKLTDPTHSVYFKPACVVDWTVNYDTPAPVPTVCTTGYTSTVFDTIVNGGWINASARGIGINNSGAVCSIRMYESHMKTDGTVEASSLQAGVACPCDYTKYTAQRVSLWFR